MLETIVRLLNCGINKVRVQWDTLINDTLNKGFTSIQRTLFVVQKHLLLYTYLQYILTSKTWTASLKRTKPSPNVSFILESPISQERDNLLLLFKKCQTLCFL